MKKWVIKGRYEAGRDIGKLLLENRGITEEKNEEFLSPPPISHYLKTLSPQFKRALRDAKALILQAIAAPQPVIIHGDYDADGICATAILYKTLIDVCGSQKTAYFIPNRFDHGYGLSLESVKEIGRLVSERFGASGGLIITTDCGITAEPKVIDRIKKMGFKLIITDHHHRGIGLPQADVLLWDDSMAGAGVAAVLAIALGLKDRQLLSLAGIATVTDLVPLRGFNRSLVKQSLETLTTNPPLGIKQLLTVAGRTSGEVSTYDLGYVIGPRLNAAGRLESAYDSLQLLLAEDEAEAVELAGKLNAVNLERQELTQQTLELADALCGDCLSDKLLTVVSQDFHEGVIGLVAGKLVQKYYKPAILVSVNGELAKGSARSVAGVNIIQLLRHFEGRFTGLGGHPMAAGFSLKTEELAQFTADFTAYTRQEIAAELLVPYLTVDLELPLELVNSDLVNQIDRLKPYGIGNPEPILVSRNVGVAAANWVGKDSTHLSLKLLANQQLYKAIIFDARQLGTFGFDLGTRLDIAYTVSSRTYRDTPYLDLVIKDFCVLGND